MLLFLCCGAQSAAASDEVHLPLRWQGMQTTGKAAMLTIRVEFQDVKFEDGIYSEQQLLAMIDGTGAETEFPDIAKGVYGSLQEYYKRSSYGKLEISTSSENVENEIYSYTLSQNRAYYAGENGGNLLLKEVLTGLDSTIDYKQYDLDKDGYIDGICINFAGMNEGRDSNWWSHVSWYRGLSKGQSDSESQENDSWDGVKAANYMLFHTQIDADSGEVNVSDSEGHRTLIHETGHMLGLDDYYNFDDASKGIQTEDMMCYNEGEHNGFSKWLLGWIEEEQILWITKEDVDENGMDVSLAPISTENPSASDKLIAVIAPEKEEENAINAEYFVVEYDQSGVGNYSGETGFRVFHVDAHLDENAYGFANHNGNGSGNRLIYAVALTDDEIMRDEYFTDGECLTPDTTESTAFYGGGSKGFTGITLTDFHIATENKTASFHVAFAEKEEIDGTLEFQADREKIGNMGRVNLTCNKSLIQNYDQTESAYFMDESGKKYPVSINLSYVDDHQVEVMYTDYQENPLKPDTTYKLVIPKGQFQLDEEVYSEECQILLKTDKYPEIVKNYIYAYEENDVAYSNLFSINENKGAKIRIKQNTEGWEAILYTISEKESTSAKQMLAYPADVLDPNDLYVSEIEGWQQQDGSIVVAMKVYAEGKQVVYIYRINQNLRTSSIEPYVIEDSVTFLSNTHGVKAISNLPNAEDKLSVYEIDFQKSPGNVTAQKKLFFPAEEIQIYNLGQGNYAIVNPSVKVNVYDSEDQLLYSLSNFDEGLSTVYAVTNTEDGIAVLHFLWDEGLEEAGAAISVFDKNGTFVEMKKLAIDTSAAEKWNFESTSFGYYITLLQQDMSAVHYFTNAGFEILSYQETSSADGAIMGNQFVYSGNTLNGTVISVTEPVILTGESEDEPNPGDGNGTGDESDTGDGSGAGNEPNTGNGSGSEDGVNDGNGSETENEPNAGNGSGLENPSGNGIGKQDVKKETEQKKPETGDENGMLLWLSIAVASVALMNLFRKKKYAK